MKWIVAIVLAVLFSGCGSDTTSVTEMPGKIVVKEQTLATNSVGELEEEETIILNDGTEEKTEEIIYDGKGDEVARIIFSKSWKLLDVNGTNKCECPVVNSCTPCKVTISRSCGSSINTQERLAEAQPADDTKMALLGATYDIVINRNVVPGDTITSGIEVKLKIPLCIYDKATGKYYDFKDNEVHYIKIWVQPVGSGEPGYWVTPNPEIINGEITFTVNTATSHMAFFGIVDKPISGSSS